MYKYLTIRNFRNIDEVKLQFGPNLNIFVGANGQGKTNILEALYLSSVGASFRYADNLNLIKNGTHESLILTTLMHGELDYDFKISILKSKKIFQLQNKKILASQINKKFPVVIFSPESLAAIKDGADQRRQLIDDALISFDPQNLELILEFKKCLKTRNKVLKDFQEENCNKIQTRVILESIEPQFLKLSVDLTVARIKAMKAILPDLNNAMHNITRFDDKKTDVEISVEYVSSGQNLLNLSNSEIEMIMKKRLIELNSAEVASGVSLVGPHKHDIKLLYNQNDSRFYCSQGQQRALILSFKMAQIVYHRKAYGAYPVLMLDDVLSELDPEKRRALISFLSEIETQIFITTTDLGLPENFMAQGTTGSCSVFCISGGKIDDRQPNSNNAIECNH